MGKGVLVGVLGATVVIALVGLVAFSGDGGRVPEVPALPSPLRTVSGAAESPPSFHVAGLMVNGPTRSSEGGDFQELAFLGSFEKTRLAVELCLPAGGLIDLDREGSALDVFQDDAGTDLIDHEDVFGPFEMLPRIAEDGRSMVFVLGSEALPQARAARLRAQGTLHVLVADEKVRYEAQDVRLEVGTRFALGPYTFEVTEAGASEWNDGLWSTTLQTNTDPSAITAFSLSVDGRELAWDPVMSMSGGSTWSRQLESDEHVGQATVRVEAWKAPKTLELPFDVSTGLGLR